MSEAEKIAAGLSAAQVKAIYPGPGNPLYAKGPLSSMLSLERQGVVKSVATFTSTSGGRSALLTSLGLEVRTILQRFPATAPLS